MTEPEQEQERHLVVMLKFAEIAKMPDEGRQLRWKIRVLAEHYYDHHDNYPVFMLYNSIEWQLRGRTGLNSADRMCLVRGAMDDVRELLDHDPTDPELNEAIGYCERLHQIVSEAMAKDRLVLTAIKQDDFKKWADELELPEAD